MDVVKTRLMKQRSLMYRNTLDCLIKTVQTEGFVALYKVTLLPPTDLLIAQGFWPTWARLGPWQFTFWVTYEQLRVITGVGSF
jgi:solute carrier family 25 uncoupling protein 27